MMAEDALQEFFAELFDDPIERLVLSGALGSEDYQRLLEKLLAAMEDAENGD